MSKLVKDLIAKEIGRRLSGVGDALLVNMVGLDGIQAQNLRKKLRDKGIKMLLVKNSMARLATKGTPLASAFETTEGSVAVVWGGEDIVALAKEVDKFAGDKAFEKFQAKGGVIDGQRIKAEEVKDVTKWPSRAEMLAKLVGQILGPGAQLAGQILGPGRKLAGQVKKKAEGAEEEAAPAADAAPSA
jgi:ribosomal protein L10